MKEAVKFILENSQSIVGFVPEQYPRSTLKVTLEKLNTPDTNRTTDRWNSYLEAAE